MQIWIWVKFIHPIPGFIWYHEWPSIFLFVILSYAYWVKKLNRFRLFNLKLNVIHLNLFIFRNLLILLSNGSIKKHSITCFELTSRITVVFCPCVWLFILWVNIVNYFFFHYFISKSVNRHWFMNYWYFFLLFFLHFWFQIRILLFLILRALACFFKLHINWVIISTLSLQLGYLSAFTMNCSNWRMVRFFSWILIWFFTKNRLLIQICILCF